MEVGHPVFSNFFSKVYFHEIFAKKEWEFSVIDLHDILRFSDKILAQKFRENKFHSKLIWRKKFA